MNISAWLELLALGGLLGALGQSARVVIGLKKLTDETTGAPESAFDSARLVVSLLIGFVAGSVAAIALGSKGGAPEALQTDQLMMLFAAGYAGADFIEGFIARSAPAMRAAGGAPGRNLQPTPAGTATT